MKVPLAAVASLRASPRSRWCRLCPYRPGSVIGESARSAASAPRGGGGSKVYFDLLGEPASLAPFFAPHRATAAALSAHYTPAYLLRCLLAGHEATPAPGVTHPAGLRCQQPSPHPPPPRDANADPDDDAPEPSLKDFCALLLDVLTPLLTRPA